MPPPENLAQWLALFAHVAAIACIAIVLSDYRRNR